MWTKSRIYLNNKNKSHSIFLFTECWNWNVTYIVLPSKKIQKRDKIGIILAGISILFINSNLCSLYYIIKKKKKIIVYAFYIDVNIRRFLLVHEFIFIVLFVNLYKRNLYRRKIKNRKKKKKKKSLYSLNISWAPQKSSGSPSCILNVRSLTSIFSCKWLTSYSHKEEKQGFKVVCPLKRKNISKLLNCKNVHFRFK